MLFEAPLTGAWGCLWAWAGVSHLSLLFPLGGHLRVRRVFWVQSGLDGSAGREESEISGILDLECPQGPNSFMFQWGDWGLWWWDSRQWWSQAWDSAFVIQQDPFVPTHICQQGSLNGHSSLGGQFCNICEHLKYWYFCPTLSILWIHVIEIFSQVL